MNGLPNSWTKAPVTEFAAIHDNRRIPLNAKQREAMKGSYPYYGANGLVDHVNDYLFDGEYTLLAEDGGYFDDAKRGVAYEASGKFWVNNHAHILEPLGGIPNRFLRHALNAFDWMQRYMAEHHSWRNTDRCPVWHGKKVPLRWRCCGSASHSKRAAWAHCIGRYQVCRFY
jgi:Type I restriction modification DNA specificity domain